MSEAGPTSAVAGASRSEELESRLARLWREGRHPDLRSFLVEAGRVAPRELAAAVAVDQHERWQSGERVPAEAYLSEHPALASDPELALEVIYSEFLLREELGEEPALDEYVRRFPQYAARLEQQGEVHRALFEQRSTLVPPRHDPPATDVAAPTVLAREGTPAAPPNLVGRPQPPGYQVFGELGRGGMGVVYKARHTQLGRMVALKMLRDVYAGPDELARFRREAEAVARLQHPNIVQIYEVGEYDGRPFFALEYVEGGSLDMRLRGEPQPPRLAAELLATLARAVAYAHARGIVHRDLKPANILMSFSRERPASADPALAGRSRLNEAVPKITDFGLAKRLEGDGLTTPDGALLGTPSYMAPEQAAGLPGAVGPRADIYALGAILYELLTGGPPFRCASLADTLLQVRTAEPLPPRRLQPTVPRDLETICLKCLAKDPARRYAGAADLADDLQRFLEDRPIRARSAGVLERARKWARRRPAVAALVAVSALALLLLSGGGWGAWLKVSRANQGEAEQRRRAEASFRQALGAVDQMLTEVGAVDLADVPQMEPVRQRLLRRALDFFNDFLSERGDDPSVRFEAARAHGRCGDILALQGQPEDARQQYEQSIALLGLVPAGPDQRRELGRGANNLGALLKNMGRFAEAEQEYDRALALRRGLADEFPDRPEYRQELASTRYLLGALLAPQRGRQKEAADSYAFARDAQERLADEFPAEPEYRRDLARTLNNLGMLQWQAGRRTAADTFRQAEQRQRELVAKAPRVPYYRRELVRTLLNRGVVLESRHDFDAAHKADEEARDLLQRLANDYATAPEYRYELAGSHHQLGRLLRDQGQGAAAETAFRAAADLCRELTEEVPLEPRYGRELGLVDIGLAILLEELGRLREAEAAYRRALGVQQALASRLHELPAYHGDLGSTQGALGLLLARRGTEEEVGVLAGLLLSGAAQDPWSALALPACARAARDDLGELRDCERGAVAEQQLALDQLEAPAPRDQEALRQHYFLLAETYLLLGEHAEAAEAARHRLPPFLPARPADYSCAAEFLIRCACLAADDPRLMPDARRTARDGYADGAVDLLERGMKQPDARPDERKALLERLRRQDCYDPLRGRPKFKRLLEEAEKGAKVGIG